MYSRQAAYRQIYWVLNATSHSFISLHFCLRKCFSIHLEVFLELCSVSVCAFDFIFVFGCAKTFSINNCISDHFVRVANTRRSMRAGNLRQKNTAWLAINCGGGGGRSCSEPSAHYRNYQTFVSSVPTNRAVVVVVVSVRRNLMFLRYVSFCFGYVWRRSSSSSSITSETVFFAHFVFVLVFLSSPLHSTKTQWISNVNASAHAFSAIATLLFSANIC